MFGKLKEVSKTIIINAGHWDDPHTPRVDDPGASHNHVLEAVECMKIRDELVPLLEHRGYVVHAVPDELNLRKSIDWANEKAVSLNAGLAIDIHLNSLSDPSARGTEAFFGTSKISEDIATVLASSVSEKLKLPNRGAKPDTQTAVGSLGWIRQTKMWASLIEVCFVSNAEDMAALQGDGGYRKAAVGIGDAVDYLFGMQQSAENPLEAYTTMQLITELQLRIKNGTL